MDNAAITWFQVITIVGAQIAVLMAFMGIAITIIVSGNKRTDAQIKASNDAIKANADSMQKFQETWAKETKDFHARLCLIEERNKVRIWNQ